MIKTICDIKIGQPKLLDTFFFLRKEQPKLLDTCNIRIKVRVS